MYRIHIYIYIRRPLPELERARLQLQSPMPSNPASPKPSNPITHPGIQASRHPSIPDCRNPLFDHLEGATARRHRGPQDVTGHLSMRTLSPPPPPLVLKLALPPTRECQMAHLTSNRHPSIQAFEHPGIQASIPPARGCQMGHLTGNRHPSSQASEHPGIQASIPQSQRSAAEAVAYNIDITCYIYHSILYHITINFQIHFFQF